MGGWVEEVVAAHWPYDRASHISSRLSVQGPRALVWQCKHCLFVSVTTKAWDDTHTHKSHSAGYTNIRRQITLEFPSLCAECWGWGMGDWLQSSLGGRGRDASRAALMADGVWFVWEERGICAKIDGALNCVETPVLQSIAVRFASNEVGLICPLTIFFFFFWWAFVHVLEYTIIYAHPLSCIPVFLSSLGVLYWIKAL